MLVSQHHLVTRNFFGSLASRELPAPALMLLGYAFGGLILAALMLLALDLFGLLTFTLSRRAGCTELVAPGLRAGIGLVRCCCRPSGSRKR